MVRRVSFYQKNFDIADIADHHRDLEASLRHYFSPSCVDYSVRFATYSYIEVQEELQLRISQIELSSSMSLLAAVEGAFRVDYLQRCYLRKKDSVSLEFRSMFRRKRERVSLEDEVFEVWKKNTEGSSSIISELRAAFKLRHWLAHGMYWQPKIGRTFDFVSVYKISQDALQYFPLEGAGM